MTTTAIPVFNAEALALAQRALLGAILLRNTAWSEAAEVFGVREEMFVDQKARLVWRAFERLARSTREPSFSVAAVSQDLLASESKDTLTKAFGSNFASNIPHYLAGVLASATGSVVEPHARLLVNEYKRRELAAYADKLFRKIQTASAEELDEVIASAPAPMDVVSGAVNANQAVRTAAEAFEQMLSGRADGTNLTYRFQWGFPTLRVMAPMISAANLIVVGARLKAGKSTLLSTIAMDVMFPGWREWDVAEVEQIAIPAGALPVVFFTAEMSFEEVLQRMWAMAANVSLTRLQWAIQNNRMDIFRGKEGEALAKWRDALKRAPFYCVDNVSLPSATIDKVRLIASSVLAKIKQEYPQHQPVVIVDYFDLYKPSGYFRSEPERAKRAADQFIEMTRFLGARYGAVVLLAAQLNRNAENRGDRPSAADFAWTDVLLRHAHLGLILHQTDEQKEIAEEVESLRDFLARARGKKERDAIVARMRPIPLTVTAVAARNNPSGWSAVLERDPFSLRIQEAV